MDVTQLIGLVALLVLLNAVFAGAEMALVSLNEGQLRKLERESGAGRVVARLAREPNRYLATVQIGITLAGFLASATAAIALAERLAPALELFGGAARALAVLVITAQLTFVTLVCGELAPKRLAMQHAERWALVAARPMSWFAAFATPAVWALSRATDVVVRVLGGEPGRRGGELTLEQLRDLVESQPLIAPMQRRIVAGAVEAGVRTLHDILRPRGEVFAIDARATVGEARRALAAAGHHRAPVHRQPALDQLVGVAHLIDLVRAADGDSILQHLRPALMLPESVPVLTALRRAQRERQQMILVVDEYGGIDGIATVEDLLEELVGEMFDQYDRDFLSVERTDDGAIVLVGGYPVHDLSDLGIALPEGEYATVGGLVASELGRIPRVGDEVLLAGWRLRVVEVRGQAVGSVRIEPMHGPPGTAA